MKMLYKFYVLTFLGASGTYGLEPKC